MKKKKKIIKKDTSKAINLRVNENITSQKVMLVCEGMPTKIYDRNEALKLANSMSLDLVEICSTSNPPVCKIIDYSKFKYAKKRHMDKIKANTKEKIVKEIKLGPNMGIGDFNTKVNAARKFLEEGKSVKTYMIFTGRTMKFKDQGAEIMNNFIESLKDLGTPEYEPKTEGRKVYTTINHT